MSKKTTIDEFITKSKLKHGDKYDYSLVNYINTHEKVKIICYKHGVFEQSPLNHLSGNRCPECYGGIKFTQEQFIDKSKIVHKNKYDYSLVNYINSRTKVKIICTKHGIFEQVPQHHMKNVGCPSCNESKGEKLLVEILNKTNLKYIREKRFKNCRYKNPLPFDFYLPEINICIEYDGEQHFRSWNKFGGIKSLNLQIIKDEIKTRYCLDNGISLIRIKYNENINEKLHMLQSTI